MKRALLAALPLLAAVFVTVALLFVDGTTLASAASKAIYVKPLANPTATPVSNSKLGGIPFASPQPACTAGAAGQYKDVNGCIYVCSGGKVSIVARSLSNTCAYPTTGATTTPTPTVTATP